MTDFIYRNLDKAALEKEYNPATTAPNAGELQVQRRERSRAAREKLLCSLDVPYGGAGGETLDIFFSGKKDSPVQLFFHGGSWRGQDKFNYSYMAEPLVAAGVTVLVVNYDLCPSVTLDEVVRQCNASVAWAYANARAFGADPNRISVCGHSAGGHLAVRTLETDWSAFGRTPDDVVKACASISGLYDLEPIRLSSTNNDVRLDVGQCLRNSPMTRTPRRRVPMILSVGDSDNNEFQRQTKDFAAALTAKSYAFDYVEAKGLNHFTILDAMLDPKHALGKALIQQALNAGRS